MDSATGERAWLYEEQEDKTGLYSNEIW